MAVSSATDGGGVLLVVAVVHRGRVLVPVLERRLVLPQHEADAVVDPAEDVADVARVLEGGPRVGVGPHGHRRVGEQGCHGPALARTSAATPAGGTSLGRRARSPGSAARAPRSSPSRRERSPSRERTDRGRGGEPASVPGNAGFLPSGRRIGSPGADRLPRPARRRRTGRCSSTPSATTRSWSSPARPGRARAPSCRSSASSSASACSGPDRPHPAPPHRRPGGGRAGRRGAAAPRSAGRRLHGPLQRPGRPGHLREGDDRRHPAGRDPARPAAPRPTRCSSSTRPTSAASTSTSSSATSASSCPQRPDLKVIITSATIDTERFADALRRRAGGRGVGPLVPGGGPLPADRRGRRATTATRRRPSATPSQELAGEGPGDVLVFLSGEREIRDTAEALGPPRPARHRGAAALRPPVGGRAAPGVRAAPRPAHRAGHQRGRDLAHRARHRRRGRPRHRPHLPLQPAHQGAAPADRADLAGLGRPAGRALRPRRPGHLHPPLLRGGLRRPPRVHRARDPAHQPGVGHPPDGGPRPGRRRGLPVRRAARRPQHQGRPAAPRGARRPRAPGGRRPRAPHQARPPPGPPAGRPPARPHGARGRPPRLRGRGAGDRGRPVDPGPARAAARTRSSAAQELHGRFADPDSDFLAYLNLWRYLRAQQKELGSSQFRRMCKAEHLHHLRIREWQDVHAPAPPGGPRPRPRRCGRWPTSPTATPSTASLLAGLLSHIGHAGTRTAHEYRGAREARFAIAPRLGARQAPPEVGDGGRAGGDEPAPGPHGRADHARPDRARRPPTSSPAATASRGGSGSGARRWTTSG